MSIFLLLPGKYIGEVVRRTLALLHSSGALCPGQPGDALGAVGAFSSEDLSAVEADSGVRQIAKDKLSLELDSDDEEIVKATCSIVTHRGAFLVAIVLAALLR